MSSLRAVYALLMVTATCSFSVVSAQNSQSKKEARIARVQQLVNNQRYVFKAQTMLPMSGRSRTLTSDYDLSITKDTLVSYLPYFGRAYSAGYNSSDNGIQFTSVNFTYTLTPKKKGGWDVTIIPKDYNAVQQMNLRISSDGYASLQVTSTSRQSISYNGYIAEKRAK
ncbi:DUF4251 domain-containing protein [Deminuibacter soli]|uniref:DUF4251 domain-containing protein n=1 Tax=Deminuibacter soli TaxID=2291815 RepID=A0A3E1NER7_9BACT|nr:DUF4251 domain-containing protein [Deminuibacter soli]RFM26352.1 DUF4251 domain-containing protein [Deminuibacter soli]